MLVRLREHAGDLCLFGGARWNVSKEPMAFGFPVSKSQRVPPNGATLVLGFPVYPLLVVQHAPWIDSLEHDYVVLKVAGSSVCKKEGAKHHLVERQ